MPEREPPRPLVSTRWLAERLGQPRLKVIDGSWYLPAMARDPAAEFAAAHIPGAVHFDLDTIADASSSLPHMAAPPAQFAAAMGALGIAETDTIVVYDGAGLFSAPRVWWNLRVMGAETVYVLDGGLPKWRAENRPVETGPARTATASFTPRPQPDAIKSVADIQQIIATRYAQIVDMRGAARFAGTAPEPRPGLRGGHMPGAFNLPIDSLVRDGRLIPTSDIWLACAERGIDPNAPLVTTCGSGVSAAAFNLALATIGIDRMALYDGSWTEWGANPALPVITGTS